MKGYPRWFSVKLILGVCLVTFLTGCLLLPTTLDLRLGIDVPWRLQGSNRNWVVAIHTTFAFCIVAILGALWSIHMRAGWKQKARRSSGALIVGSNIMLIVTGIGIFYLPNEQAALVDSLFHVGLGLISVPLLLWHLAQPKV